ncbi:hypothetical protein EYF80_068280 [Liparis tanakae]|uniref:Uncharacterized protein n=1 Tax=Liparis tanakae TaxID=230148 RepID=A0A4Z2DYV5_9TELE|nr:hypothetical protein EYF80_068280 [Liparis tanakae]
MPLTMSWDRGPAAAWLGPAAFDSSSTIRPRVWRLCRLSYTPAAFVFLTSFRHPAAICCEAASSSYTCSHGPVLMSDVLGAGNGVNSFGERMWRAVRFLQWKGLDVG